LKWSRVLIACNGNDNLLVDAGIYIEGYSVRVDSPVAARSRLRQHPKFRHHELDNRLGNQLVIDLTLTYRALGALLDLVAGRSAVFQRRWT
jgi:hypothetical protein